MPDHDKLLSAKLPQALETALEQIDRAHDLPQQLLKADVSSFEALECCVFAYFSRDDVFYLNQAGRNLLRMKLPSLDQTGSSAPPIFWLEDDNNLLQADAFVTTRQKPIFDTRELVTLSWGKTWLQGAKFPIRSRQGQTIALLFAGAELAPSKQIQLVADHYKNTQQGFGEN